MLILHLSLFQLSAYADWKENWLDHGFRYYSSNQITTTHPYIDFEVCYYDSDGLDDMIGDTYANETYIEFNDGSKFTKYIYPYSVANSSTDVDSYVSKNNSEIFGNIELLNSYTDGDQSWKKFRYWPSERALSAGVKKFRLKISWWQDYGKSKFDLTKEFDVVQKVNGYEQPSNLKATFDMWSKQVTLTWQRDTENRITGGVYKVYRYNPTDDTRDLLKTLDPKTSMSYIDEKIDYDKTYSYFVSFCPSENGGQSIPDEWLTKSVMCNTKINFGISNFIGRAKFNSIDLSWETIEVPSDQNVFFEVSRSMSESGPFEVINKLQISKDNKYEYSDLSVEECNDYYYVVTANVLGKAISSNIYHSQVEGQSKVLSMSTSKGLYANKTLIHWDADQIGTDVTTFNVYRKKVESDEKWELLLKKSGNSNEYDYEDETAVPGCYYEYKVESIGHCSKEVNGSISDIGYPSPTGTISGSVTYGTMGMGVPNVKVCASQSFGGKSDSRYYSRRLGDVFYIQYNDDLEDFFYSKSFSLQMWARVDSLQTLSSPYIVDKMGDFSLYLERESSSDLNFQCVLRISGKDGWDVYPTNIYLEANKYSHITISKDEQSNWSVCVIQNGQLKEYEVKNHPINNKARVKMLVFGWDALGGDATNFTNGYIDEVRLWNKKLTNGEILSNYNRILTGSESNLSFYFPMDEGLDKYCFDISKKNSDYETTITLGNTVSSNIVPADSIFSLYAITDENGYYKIGGVPILSEGGTYTVVPSMDLHVYEPSKKNCEISATSSSANNIDFSDKSSFSVSGTISYEGTEYPVDSVMFYVDETLCAKEGNPIYSDHEGKFTIEVPIGDHYIKIKRTGHEFENEGRFPKEGNLTFTNPMSDINFNDITLVTVVGRVAGGDIEQNKPHGMGLGKNNIGTATVTFDCGFNMTKGSDRILEVDGDKVNSTATATGKKIKIVTDPETGEFSLRMPPVLIKSTEVSIKSNGELPIFPSQTADLSKRTILMNSQQDTFVKISEEKVDTIVYTYNKAMNFIYHSDPTLVVSQNGAVNEGALKDAFGEPTYEYQDETMDEPMLVEMYSLQDGKINYTFNHPVYIQTASYEWDFYGYEEYINKDDLSDVKVDRVPLKDVIVRISNELGAKTVVSSIDEPSSDNEGFSVGDVYQLEEDEIRLDSMGCQKYFWMASFPQISGDYTRNVDISYKVAGKTYAYNGDTVITKGIVMGCLPTGNNFVTAGPDIISYILRDPAGSNSYASLEKGSVISTTQSQSISSNKNTSVSSSTQLGASIETAVGLGVMKITRINISQSLTTTMADGESYAMTKTEKSEISLKEAVSTSKENDFVGAQGDVFIGSGTNLIFGKARELKLKEDKNVANKYKLYVDDAINVSQEFTTQFNYTQSYIEETLIPNLRLIRDGFFSEKLYNSEIKNMTDHPVCFSKYSKQESRYGMNNEIKTEESNFAGDSYVWLFPEGSTGWDGNSFVDSIALYNSYIENWELALADNEKAKVIAIKSWSSEDNTYDSDVASSIANTLAENRKWNNDHKEDISSGEVAPKSTDLESLCENLNFSWFNKNISFDAGVASENAESFCSNISTSINRSFSVNATIGGNTGLSVDGLGFNINYSTSFGSSESSSIDQSETQCLTIKYNLAEEGDDALSIDVFHAPDGFGPIFYTRGGQTSCPYEGKVTTKYYKPGSVISEATMKIEAPEITAENKTITDIHNGSTANFVLNLINNSEIYSEGGKEVIGSFMLSVDDASNSNGAIISINGDVLTQNRPVKVPAGDFTKLNLQMKQSRLDLINYDKIGIILSSSCGDISDTVFLSAQFEPICSPVSLAIDKTTLEPDEDEIRLEVSDYDRSFVTLDRFELCYKEENDNQWTIDNSFDVNVSDISSNSFVRTLTMTSKPKQTLFMIRTVCPTGPNTFVYGNSDVLEVVKQAPIVTTTNEEESDLNVVVYPNITEGEIFVSTIKDVENILVYNALGQFVFNAKNTDRINLSGCEPGSYFVKVITNDGYSIVEQVIKK